TAIPVTLPRPWVTTPPCPKDGSRLPARRRPGILAQWSDADSAFPCPTAGPTSTTRPATAAATNAHRPRIIRVLSVGEQLPSHRTEPDDARHRAPRQENRLDNAATRDMLVFGLVDGGTE